ncbi:MAG: biopolymer transporter ExbD [Deltaproteobacteria bacterium]|nr:MAG: biopolymer transporter ExbD [Deltaproteobacteria bacterium]
MNFRSSRKRSRRAEVTLEVTSLVDVVFLLIIFLLVTTTFKQNEYAFVIDLPTSGVKEVTVSTDKTTVFITKDGDMYLLEVPADRPVDGGNVDPSKKVTAKELEARLKTLQERRPDASIAIRGERSTSYQSMMDVVSVLQDIGFRNIWFPYEFSDGGAGGGAPAPTPGP